MGHFQMTLTSVRCSVVMGSQSVSLNTITLIWNVSCWQTHSPTLSQLCSLNHINTDSGWLSHDIYIPLWHIFIVKKVVFFKCNTSAQHIASKKVFLAGRVDTGVSVTQRRLSGGFRWRNVFFKCIRDDGLWMKKKIPLVITTR